MTSDSDLVTRLRQDRRPPGDGILANLLDEAADRIEALEREVRRLNNAMRHMRENKHDRLERADP